YHVDQAPEGDGRKNGGDAGSELSGEIRAPAGDGARVHQNGAGLKRPYGNRDGRSQVQHSHRRGARGYAAIPQLAEFIVAPAFHRCVVEEGGGVTVGRGKADAMRQRSFLSTDARGAGRTGNKCGEYEQKSQSVPHMTSSIRWGQNYLSRPVRIFGDAALIAN